MQLFYFTRQQLRRLLVLLILFFIGKSVHAQVPWVGGKVFADSGVFMAKVRIQLLDPIDSGIIAQTYVDNDGSFALVKRSGTFVLKLSSAGFYTTWKSIKLFDTSTWLGSFTLVHFDKNTLKEAEVIGNVPIAKIKGDTTEYNASAVKTNPDATTEDLINKLPGVTNVNGKVQVQGEDVKKVMVDGKPFFGDDPSATLKNLPAEVVDKIQVFDRKSDQAQFTGFDDGNSSKTMNIVTKMQYRNGAFGRAYAGYGLDDKYKGGFSYNNFKGNRRLTLLGAGNNVNDQNFASEDLLGIGGGGMGGMRGGMGSRGGGSSGGSMGGGSSSFMVDPKNGITSTQAFGLNFSNKWKKVDFSASYFLNHSDNQTTANTYRTYITKGNIGLLYNELSSASTNNLNHRMNFRIDLKLDSLNSILFTPSLSYQNNKSTGLTTGNNLALTEVLSTAKNGYDNKLQGVNISVPVLYRHSFKLKGRTLSINATPGLNTSNGVNKWNTATDFVQDTFAADSFNQRATVPKIGSSIATSINYTEPLSTASILTFTVASNQTIYKNDKRTYKYENGTGEFSIFDTILSNSFSSKYQSIQVGTGYRYNKKKINLTTGVNYQFATLRNNQVFPLNYQLNKQFNSVLPNAMLTYKVSDTRNFRVNYRTSNNAPSIDQLQPVINNTNALQLSTGNSALKQDYQHSMFARYSAANQKKSTSFFVMLGGTITRNYIGNSTFISPKDTQIAENIFLKRGSQLSMPVNLSGNRSLRSFANYSMPLKWLRSNLNLNAGISISRTPGIVNGAMNNATNSNANFGVVISSNISEKIDFTVSTSSAYNMIDNSLQKELNSVYFNQNSRIKMQINPWKGLVLATDLTHQYYSGLSSNLTQNYILWNAAIAWKFGKKKLSELRFYTFDMLKQNNSVSRNTTETYYEDVQTKVLTRYYMLTFTYNFRKFKSGQSGLPTGQRPADMPWHMPGR